MSKKKTEKEIEELVRTTLEYIRAISIIPVNEEDDAIVEKLLNDKFDKNNNKTKILKVKKENEN